MMNCEKYEDISKFVDHINKYYGCKYYKTNVSIIAKYDETVQIIEELVCKGYGLFNIELEPCIDNGDYNDEYIIDIIDALITCQKMKYEDKYIDSYSDVHYITGDCNSKIISHLKSLKVIELSFDYDDIDFNNKHKSETKMENKSIEEKNDNKTNSSSTNISVKINDKELSEKEVKEILIDTLLKHFSDNKRTNDREKELDKYFDDLVDFSSILRSYRNLISW